MGVTMFYSSDRMVCVGHRQVRKETGWKECERDGPSGDGGRGGGVNGGEVERGCADSNHPGPAY